MDAEDYFEPPWDRWSDGDWDELVQRGGAGCTFCDEVVNDRRFMCALAIHRAWDPGAPEMRYAHVECLRAAMHANHKLG